MTKQFMEDNPPVVRGVFVLLEGFYLGGIDKGAGLSFVAFSAHSIRNDYVLKTALFADVIILNNLSDGDLIRQAVMRTFGKLIPGKMILEQYARAV